MAAIHKQEIPIQDTIVLPMCKTDIVLCFQMQYGKPNIWYITDPESDDVTTRTFYLRCTGQSLKEAENAKYIGTVQMYNGSLVYHLFEKTPVEQGGLMVTNEFKKLEK